MPSASPLPTSAADAEHLALAHVMAWSRPPTDEGWYRFWIPEPAKEVEGGWCVRVAVRCVDAATHQEEEPYGGPHCFFVDAHTGQLITLWPFTMPLQATIYRIMQGYAPQLPWPRLVIVDVGEREHYWHNLAPTKTLCGDPLTGTEPQRPIGTLRVDATTCGMCCAFTNGLGRYCQHCGTYLRDITTWTCADCPALTPA